MVRPWPTTFTDGLVPEGEKAPAAATRTSRDTARRLGKMRGVRAHGYSRKVLAQPERLSELGIPSTDPRERLREPPDRRGHSRGARGRASIDRSPRVSG